MYEILFIYLFLFDFDILVEFCDDANATNNDNQSATNNDNNDNIPSKMCSFVCVCVCLLSIFAPGEFICESLFSV